MKSIHNEKERRNPLNISSFLRLYKEPTAQNNADILIASIQYSFRSSLELGKLKANAGLAMSNIEQKQEINKIAKLLENFILKFINCMNSKILKTI